MTVTLDDVFKGFARNRTVCHIEGHGFSANFRGSFGNRCRVASVNDDMRAVFLQRLCHGATQPAR